LNDCITYFNFLILTIKAIIEVTEIIKYKAAAEDTPARAPIQLLLELCSLVVVVVVKLVVYLLRDVAKSVIIVWKRKHVI